MSFVRSLTAISILWLFASQHSAWAQVEISGRLRAECHAKSVPMTEIRAFASPLGGDGQSLSFRTWQSEPVGWFRFSGPADNYTLLFTEPAHFMRPVVVTNMALEDGERITSLRVQPRFAYATFDDTQWDGAPARAYYQPFFASGTSVTQVGFKLATDGVDGFGPKRQAVRVSLHRVQGDKPQAWPQVGPAMVAPHVDCGGAKSYHFSVGWNSGEAPTTPGASYAVRLQPVAEKGRFQTFWADAGDDAARCWRSDGERVERTAKQLWMTVAEDGDGLRIPYNKRVHRAFGEFAGGGACWAQTYVAQGKDLAGVVCYAAVSGAQPPLSRQRVRVSVHAGAPDGPQVGVAKIAVGEGHYTGDASWGVFGVAFAPGEVRLEPGRTYAIKLTTIETEHTIGNFVNIKGVRSDGRAFFNPYRKDELDSYAQGTAYRGGKEAVDFDLDMQILEYARRVDDWANACRAGNLLDKSRWRAFTEKQIQPAHEVREFQIRAPDANSPTDAGYVQRVARLDKTQAYRFLARVRCTWAADVDHRCRIGIDRTGQASDPHAESITWQSPVIRHGQWIEFTSGMFRPAENSVSIWLHGASRPEQKFTFVAEFDRLQMLAVEHDPPAEANAENNVERRAAGRPKASGTPASMRPS